MKRIIGASCVFLCDEKFSILQNAGVLFQCDPQTQQNKILAISDFESLKSKYPLIPSSFHKDCVLLPALSNAHIHLEFSNNQSHLMYGDFPSWLKSVITHRDELFENLQTSIKKEIELQLEGGIASIGAISSYGFDISLLSQSPLRVTLFNEAIGSNPQALDFLYANLCERLEETQKLKNSKFRPALAIHSPYSTHFVFAKKVANLAREKGLKISCHFLESQEEKQWLEEKKGWFKEFFTSFFNQANAQPSMDAYQFLDLFKDLSPLFVHCLFANEEILSEISNLNGFIVSCPRSNRLLNNVYLDLQSLKKLHLSPIFSTDGLSSNYSLNLIEEIRNAFFGYVNLNATELAKDLILGITALPAEALGIQNGTIAKNKLADLAVFECKGISQSKQQSLHFILHAHTKVKELFINGIGVRNERTI